MERKTIDAVICTKNRPDFLLSASERVFKNIKPDRFFIYDGSDQQNPVLQYHLFRNFGATIIDVRGLSFGGVRNLAMKNSDADYVAMMDDDILYGGDWLPKTMIRFSDPSVVAVNSRLILGDKGTIIHKISLCAGRDSGGSGGACVYDRKKILALGNFDKNIHRGEDMELKLRIQLKGFKWVMSSAVAFHPLSDPLAFFKRAKVDSVGYNYVLEHSEHRTRFFLERVVSLAIMPVYYGWRTRDPRAWAYWLVYRLNGLFAFLAKTYEIWGDSN